MSGPRIHFAPLRLLTLLAALLAGCGDSDAPHTAGTAAVGGSPPTVTTPATAPAPTVTAVSPLSQAAGVPINEGVISVAFDQPMAAIAGSASFTLTCEAPCSNATGTLVRDASNKIASFTLPAGVTLAPLRLYTATVAGASSLAADLPLAKPFVWQFTTGLTADSSRPRVLSTFPATTIPGPTSGAATNAAISVIFSEDMDPASINAASFTVTCAAPCTAPTGTIAYSLTNRSASFTPAAALTVGALYTATITTTAADLSGNALAGNQAALPAASDFVWSFMTSAASVPGTLTVTSTNPAAAQTAVCPAATINASFEAPSGLRLDASSINSSTFVLKGPAPSVAVVAATSVTLDAATGLIATFAPQGALTPGGSYTVTLVAGGGGIRDLAVPADQLSVNDSWSFTVGPGGGDCVAAPALGSVAPYGIFGGSAGMTNTGTQTVINGDIGTVATATSSITGFDDTAADVYTETPADIGTVNGSIYSCTNSTTGPDAAAPDPVACAAATQARMDAQRAYLALAAMPTGANPGGNLGGLVLTPGVYTAPAGSFEILGSALTLDAKGDVNAVWVFQMASTLTVGGPGAAAPESVLLVGGAQAGNVYWQVGSAATVNAAGGGTMVGTIISQAGAAFSTVGNTAIATLNGRALSLNASVTVVNTVINVPAP